MFVLIFVLIGSNANYANTNSGNEKPGYPQVNSNPQLVSHNSSGYPGNQYSGVNLEPQSQQQTASTNIQQQMQPQSQQPEQQTQQWPLNSENMMWEPNISHQHPNKRNMDHRNEIVSQYNQNPHNDPGDQYSNQSNRVELNSRIKTMILNKHHVDRKHEENQQHDNENKTGHFLWYSHHHRPSDIIGDGGGVPFKLPTTRHNTNSRQAITNVTDTKILPQNILNDVNTDHHYQKNKKDSLDCTKEDTNEHVKTFTNENFYSGSTCDPKRTNKVESAYDNFNRESLSNTNQPKYATNHHKIDSKSDISSDKNKIKKDLEGSKIKNVGSEIPICNCFPQDRLPPEPGTYYTHLGK